MSESPSRHLDNFDLISQEIEAAYRPFRVRAKVIEVLDNSLMLDDVRIRVTNTIDDVHVVLINNRQLHESAMWPRYIGITAGAYFASLKKEVPSNIVLGYN